MNAPLQGGLPALSSAIHGAPSPPRHRLHRGLAITQAPALPPGFRAHPAPDPLAAALAHAHADDDPGTIFWSDAEGHGRAAIVLAPDRPILPATLDTLGLVALYDALATLAPPQVPIHLAPPSAVLIEGAHAATVTTHQAEGQPPAWAIIAIDVAIAPLGNDPGLTLDQTSLIEEGFGDIATQDLVAQFCRHLLVWIDTWQAEGPASLARSAAEYSLTVPA